MEKSGGLWSEVGSMEFCWSPSPTPGCGLTFGLAGSWDLGGRMEEGWKGRGMHNILQGKFLEVATGHFRFYFLSQTLGNGHASLQEGWQVCSLSLCSSIPRCKVHGCQKQEKVSGAVSATDAFSAVSTFLLQFPPLYSLEPWALSQRSHETPFDIPDLWKSLEEGVGTESKQEDWAVFCSSSLPPLEILYKKQPVGRL